MTARIQLQNGRGEVLVDAELEQLLRLRKWWIRPNACGGYAYTSVNVDGKQVKLSMHRVIMGATPGDGRIVDHINGFGLDNRRSNLRFVTASQNAQNSRSHKPSKLGVRGVDRVGKRYRATVMAGGEKHVLGYFDTPEEAGAAYDAGAKRLQGEFAVTNGSR